MKLIERKCPNCGATLEFKETDKSCKCKYCNSFYEIERDEKEDLEKNIKLKKLKGPLQAFALAYLGTYFFTAFVFVIIFIISCFVIFAGIHSMDGKILFKNVDELSNEQLEDLDNKAYWIINENDDVSNYYLNMSVKRVLTYVGYSKEKKKDIIIPVYKIKYEKLLHAGDSYTLYVPIYYENIYNNSRFVFQLGNGKIDSKEYHFNDDESAYGYLSLDELYKDYIKPFEKNYEITKK